MDSRNINKIMQDAPLDPSKNARETANSFAGKHTQTCDVLSEIEKITKEINSLLEKAPRDDPAYQTNVKKLVEIKAFLERKMNPDKRNLIEKVLRRKKKVNLDSTYAEEAESLDLTQSEFLLNQENYLEQPQDLININLDDSILFGIETLICAYQFIKSFGS